MSSDLGKKASSAVMWSGIDRFLTQFLQFAITIVVARMVSPADYGIIAIISVFTSLSQVFIDSGFSEALIQKNTSEEKDFSTVFWFSLVVGLFIYALLFISAPLIEAFYKIQSLTLYIRVVCVNILINSLTIVYKAKILIFLNFRSNTKISLISIIISGIIAIFLAYHGLGIWALISQNIISNVVIFGGLYFVIRWTPKNIFSRQSFNSLFSYGGKLLFANVLNSIYLNLYSLCIGKLFSATELGLYNRASSLAQFPSTNISSIIDRAMFPIICKVQDNQESFSAIFCKTIGVLTYLVFPLMLTMCFLGDAIILSLLGEQWSECIPLLRILCIAYILTPIMRLINNTINARGRSDITLRAEYLKKIVSVILLAATVPFGLKIMCIGLIIYELFDCIIMLVALRKILPNIKLFIILKSIKNTIIANLYLCVIFSVLSLLALSSWIELFICGIIAVLFYILISSFLKIEEWIYIRKFILNILRR